MDDLEQLVDDAAEALRVAVAKIAAARDYAQKLGRENHSVELRLARSALTRAEGLAMQAREVLL
jgi:hypothetical protein